jgi:predicted transposase/invertase (TIGR01784 family)
MDSQRRYFNPENDINNSNIKHFRDGKEEGLKEGERKKAMEIARNLKTAGVDTAVIQVTTGLTEEEISQL